MLSRERNQSVRLAAEFRAIGDPTRVQILHLLVAGERCVCDLTEALDAAQSRLSFHLKTMKEAGLIRDRRHGRWVYYAIVPEKLSSLAGTLQALAQPGRDAQRRPTLGRPPHPRGG